MSNEPEPVEQDLIEGLVGAAPALSALETIRHSCAHVMAKAVQKLWPDAKVTIGPSIETGFYYDFDLDHAFTEDDLEKISAEMRKIIGANESFVRHEVSREEALRRFADLGESYKVEIIVAGAAPGLYEYACAGGEACQQDIFFPELILDRIVVKVTTSLGSRTTEIPNPVYARSRPNGPDCPPLCLQTSVTAQLPGS